MAEPCSLVALRSVGGQEYGLAFMLKTRVEARGLDSVKATAIIVVPSLKGFVFVENSPQYEAQNLALGIKHFRGIVRGVINVDEVLGLLTRPVEVSVGDVVEIVVDPFRGYRGRVVDVDVQKGQVHLELIDAPSPMPIVINIKSVRKVQERASTA